MPDPFTAPNPPISEDDANVFALGVSVNAEETPGQLAFSVLPGRAIRLETVVFDLETDAPTIVSYVNLNTSELECLVKTGVEILAKAARS